jgi:hypothetical protein
MNSETGTRALTAEEYFLALWMLEHGDASGRKFIAQLECAEATTWRCVCGCASFNFKIADYPVPPPGVRILGDYIFGGEDDVAGIFIFESEGVLSGVEVYGLAGDAPASLPKPEQLRSFGSISGAGKTKRHG